MGRRRKSSKFGNPKRSKEKTQTSFDCPFCNGSETVDCLLDKEKAVGMVRCHMCDASFSTKITPLSEPLDVYCEWIDACEDANIVE